MWVFWILGVDGVLPVAEILKGFFSICVDIDGSLLFVEVNHPNHDYVDLVTNTGVVVKI